MANFTAGSFAPDPVRYYKRNFERCKDIFNNVNNEIGRKLRFNSILQAIQEYKQINPSLRIIKELGFGDEIITLTKIVGNREALIRFSILGKNAIYLSEKTDPNWKEFIKILNRKFYEGRNLYNAYLEKVKEICGIRDSCDCCGKSQDISNINDYDELCVCWCNICKVNYKKCRCYKADDEELNDLKVKLLIRKLPLEYDVKVEYVGNTKMMIKGKEMNSSKARIFRNTQAIVYADITGFKFIDGVEYYNYISNITDKLIEFNLELKELNTILINEIIDDCPYLNEAPNYEECCVCYEIVNTKTKKCSHILCKKCVDKLRNKNCPICRRGL